MNLLKRWLLLFAVISGLLCSCSANTQDISATSVMEALETKVVSATVTPTPESLPHTKLPTSASVTSQVLLFDDWPKEGFPTDDAKITTILLEKNILNIQVIYQGGCQEHIFALYAWTGFLQSNPPQGELYLSHDSHGDPCTKTMEKLLSFDLTLLDESRTDRHANPLILRVNEPAGGSFADEPYKPLIEWP